MARKRFVLAGVGIGITILITIVATFTPALEYDPRTVTAPTGTKIVSPAQIVEEFLRRYGQLPQPGTGLVLRDGALAWEAAPDKLAERITDVTVWRVRLTAGAPLLMSALDDDPTCGAEVNVIVTTADGQEIPLVVELWDYCLLTPWSLHSRGDGWKPGRVHWPETGRQGSNE